MLQVDQASHFDRDIAQRYPTGTQFVGPSAQVDQVVVSARAVAIARVGEAHDLSLMQVGLSRQKLLIEVPETGHGAEILELLRTDDIKERFRSRRDGLKEMTTEVQNDVLIKEPLQPEVAVLSKLFPQLLQWQVCIGRLEPTQSLRCHFQCITIADQWLVERSHAIAFLSKGEGQAPRLIAGPPRTFQSFAHLLESCAIDLAACIAPAQDLQRVRLQRRVIMRGDRPAPVSPAEPAARTPAEEYNQPYPKQWQQRPESKSPKHIRPLFLSYSLLFSWLVQQTRCLSLYPQYIL